MKRKKILLAEDDDDDKNLFVEYLKEREDILILPVAENGIDIIHYLEKPASGLPHLIILDQNMPKKNGLETLTALKANHLYKRIPVIIYSTYADAQLMNDCMHRGAALVITKPLNHQGYNEMMDLLLAAI